MRRIENSIERAKRMAEVGRDATKASDTSWQFVAIINELEKTLRLIRSLENK